MPQPKKAAKRSAKKPAAKKKPAARRPPEPEVQVNRVNEQTEAPPQDERSEQTESEEQPRSTRNELDQYEQVHEPLEHAGFDHHAAEEKRQAELAAARDEHNRRTGDASR